MNNDVTFRWQVPPSLLANNVGNYVERVLNAVFDLAQLFAAKIQTYAAVHAPWIDRTGNARQGLTARAFKTATAVSLYLWHSVSYGIFLELAHGGRFAIILKAMQAHYSQYMRAIQETLR